MAWTRVSIFLGFAALATGLGGCATGPDTSVGRGAYYERPADCALRKGSNRNALACSLPGPATHDRLFTAQINVSPASDAQRAGHARSGAAYWLAALETRNRTNARDVGTVLRERYTAEDPGPRNATACLRIETTVAAAEFDGVADIRRLECVYYYEDSGQKELATLEYIEARTVPGPVTPEFEGLAEAGLSTLRFLPLDEFS